MKTHIHYPGIVYVIDSQPWKEDKHPRAKDGRFGEKSRQSAAPSAPKSSGPAESSEPNGGPVGKALEAPFTINRRIDTYYTSRYSRRAKKLTDDPSVPRSKAITAHKNAMNVHQQSADYFKENGEPDSVKLHEKWVAHHKAEIARLEGGGGSTSETKPQNVETKPQKPEKKKDEYYYVHEQAAQWAAELDFPYPERIKVSPEVEHFNFGGMSGTYAGSCDLNTGEITLYPNGGYSGDAAIGILAHEVMHAKFEAVLGKYKRELDAVLGAQREGATVFDEHNNLTKELAERYPLLAELRPILNTQSQQWADEDGVTQYSRDWWANFKAGKAHLKNAIHETLAEISYLDAMKNNPIFRNNPAYASRRRADHFSRLARQEVSPLWRKLYDTVNTAYAKMNAKRSAA